jgi:hypothetical protein
VYIHKVEECVETFLNLLIEEFTAKASALLYCTFYKTLRAYVMSHGARQVGAGQICRVHVEASRPSLEFDILGIKLLHLYHDFAARF